MNIFNIVHNRLTEKNFKALDSDEIEKLGFSLYENEKTRVLLKQLHTDLELENIQLYSNQIRNFLLDHSKNIYNSYLILCTDENIDHESFFIIERDNVALRKYIIRSESDLNRIPFLDNNIYDRENGTKKLNDVDYSSELESIFSLLDSYDGKNIKLKDFQVNEIVEILMQGVEKNHEY